MTGLMRSEHSAGSRATSPRFRSLRGGIAAMVGVSVLMLSACDWRLETEPVAFPSPDAVTAARDSLADAEAEVIVAATAVGRSADEVAVGAAATAQAHLDALGGVYVPYPGETPSPSPSAATPPPTLAEAITAMRSVAESVAATTTDANLAFLARSINLDWALRGLWAERSTAKATADEADASAAAQVAASGTPYPTEIAAAPSEPVLLPGDIGESPFPLADGTANDAAGFAPASASQTGIGPEQLISLILAEDEARFAYETIAALEFAHRRDDVLARSRLHASRSDSLAVMLGTEATASDPRTPLYQLRDANLSDSASREALKLSIEIDLGVRYSVLLDGASAADAAWLLNASFDSYARAMATAGFTTADLPTLPGLVVGP